MENANDNLNEENELGGQSDASSISNETVSSVTGTESDQEISNNPAETGSSETDIESPNQEVSDDADETASSGKNTESNLDMRINTTRMEVFRRSIYLVIIEMYPESIITIDMGISHRIQ